MNSYPKVVGFVQAQDDWPLLALSVTHALMHHVDEVFVLNHGGNDATSTGLAKLAAHWPGRMTVLDLYDQAFFQEASSCVLLEACQSASPDWIYAFDADEFLLTRDRKPLKSILGKVGPSHAAVRYHVQNWVSFQDFDDAEPDAYMRLRFRSEPSLFTSQSAEKLVDEIGSGTLNFYDVPFRSKVIFRNVKNAWPSAGAHYLKSPDDASVLEVDIADLRAAHLPLLSRRRLQLRVRQGEQLIKDGFPLNHGWQSQMVYAQWKEGNLDEFWRRHALSSNAPEAGDRTLPKFVEDEAFIQCIEPTLSFFKAKFVSEAILSREAPSATVKRQDSRIALRTAIHSTRRMQSIANEARANVASLKAELDQTAIGLRAQIDDLSKQLAKARSRPMSVLWDLIYCRILVFAANRKLPWSTHARTKLIRSAQKRDPKRSIGGSIFYLDGDL